MKDIGITVYGCERDEAAAFRALAPRFGVMPSIIGAGLSKANVLSARGDRCISVNHRSEVSAPILFALKDAGVKYISTRSVGCEHIDLAAAGRAGVAVGNVAYSPDSVADYTVMLMLMAVRNAKSLVRSVEKRDFRLGGVRGKALRDMTIGVLGTGHIGKAVIERLRGFGCSVLAYDRSPQAYLSYDGNEDKNEPPPFCPFRPVSFDEVLHSSDIVTLHMPLNADTRHIIGREQLRHMKRGAFLVNTGRGALVETDALTCALEDGTLGGAALDVIEGEKGLFYFDCSKRPIDNRSLLKLQQMPNVIITPHTAYYTEQALRDTALKTIENCLNFERNLVASNG
jgi:D-specific alpha-keto acid dehydrogenase